MLGHGHHWVSLGEGRREHDGADKTLIASICDMKTSIKYSSVTQTLSITDLIVKLLVPILMLRGSLCMLYDV